MNSVPESSPEEWEAAHARMERERAFWSEHWAEFLEKYPQRWLAVRDGEIFS